MFLPELSLCPLLSGEGLVSEPEDEVEEDQEGERRRTRRGRGVLNLHLERLLLSSLEAVSVLRRGCC